MHLAFDSNSPTHIPTVRDTVAYIKEIHSDQTDQNGQPFYAHPLRVAKLAKILDPNVSLDTLKGALLHDSIEDGVTSRKELEAKNHTEDTIYIAEKSARDPKDRRPHSEWIQDIIDSGDKRVMLVKLVDALDNNNEGRLEELSAQDAATAERLSNKYTTATRMLANALGIDWEMCEKLRQRDIKMDEEFTGEKFYVLDGNPIRAVWDEGIISEVYGIQDNLVVRNDALAFYIETELTAKDEISRDVYSELMVAKNVKENNIT